MNYHNAFERIQYYYSKMISSSTLENEYNTEDDYEDGYEEGISIAELHRDSGIPLSVIRSDIICHMQYTHNLLAKGIPETFGNSVSLSLYPDEEDETMVDFIESLTEHLDNPNHLARLSDLFRSGDLDDVRLNRTNYNLSGNYFLPLTPEEATALKNHLSDVNEMESGLSLIDHAFRANFQIKDSFRYFTKYTNLNQLLSFLNQAISDKKSIRILYSQRHGNLTYYTFIPLKISYDVNDNSYSVITSIDSKVHIFLLENIRHCEYSKEKLPYLDTSFLAIAPNVWGNSFSDQPVKVKVKFYKEANVFEKVKKELACRTNGKLYEKGNYLFYEDTIYGIQRFTSWLYGYGSSVIVLKPASLQNRIIESYKKRLEPVSLDYL